jgi:inner membrane transporter RhtA
VVFAAWRRPWRRYRRLAAPQRRLLLALGAVLAAMNTVFYLAIQRLPLATVGGIEFLGVIVLAAVGVRTRRNAVAVALAAGGVFLLTDVRFAGAPLGFGYAFANCLLFMAYVTVGHRVAGAGSPGGSGWGGVDQLAAAMLVALVAVTPVGAAPAAAAFTHPGWLLAGLAVGVCSSVVPYVSDQLAMARLRRATFALMLTTLPASAVVIGFVVLGQRPTGADLVGVLLVAAAVASHQQPAPGDPRKEPRCSTTDSARPA